jgi:hypothetical protein
LPGVRRVRVVATEAVFLAGDVYYFLEGHTVIVDKNAQATCVVVEFANWADRVEAEAAIAKAAKT